MLQPSINLLWFKRDLRLEDHAPLAAAVQAAKPVLMFFCLEPRLMNAPDADLRHWRFAWQAAQDLGQQLNKHNLYLLICHKDVLDVLDLLSAHFSIEKLFSHQETGNKLSFDRDKAVQKWCTTHQVKWQEFVQDGIVRGKKNRLDWGKQMDDFLQSPLVKVDKSKLKNPELPDFIRNVLEGETLPHAITAANESFQPGGSTFARRYWQSFLEGRGENYGRFMSKPHLSRRSCSRLSPYLAWGNISIKELWQYCKIHENTNNRMGRALRNFRERLWWRGHYLQKLESEWQMEFQPINKGFNQLDRTFDEQRFSVWAEGQTGYPMVDASMRCLRETGWLNFRMRAMLATFATFTLWLPLEPVALHLARLFLDYEPGIHYPQLQMQAGLTGYHTLRIYNPNVQAERHDKDGVFIHKWIPELRHVPAPQCHYPWRLTIMEQQLYRCEIGKDYPAPIVDFKKTNRMYSARYWEVRQSQEVQGQLPAVWERHCLPESIIAYKKGQQPMGMDENS